MKYKIALFDEVNQKMTHVYVEADSLEEAAIELEASFKKHFKDLPQVALSRIVFH